MSALKEWVKNLVFIILFTTMLEMFLPENKMRKYVRVIMGFFIISIFLSPLVALFGFDLETTYSLIPERVMNDNWEEIKRQGQEIEHTNQNMIREYYKKRISKRILDLINLDFSDYEKSVEVELDENYRLSAVTVHLDKKQGISTVDIKPVKIGEINQQDQGQKDIENRDKLDTSLIKAKISQVFQIPYNNIKVITQESEGG